jgi:hypothetical protein
MTLHHLPLFAGIEEFIGALIPLVVFIIWVLNQVFGKLAQPGPAQRPRPDVRRPNPPLAQAQGPRPRAAVDDEIENFLRRAAQQRAGQRPPEPLRPQPVQPPPEPARRLVQRGEIFDQPVAVQPEALVEAVAVDDRVLTSGTTKELSQRHLEPTDFGKHEPIVSAVEFADEQMQAHLQQTFDHRLGTLARQATADSADAAANIRTTAAGVAVLLRNPGTLRQAVLLQEILTRPEHKW